MTKRKFSSGSASIDARELKRKFEEAKAQFILSELSLAVTFCEIAESTRDPERAQINRANARRAYEAAAYYLQNVWVTTAEETEIQAKMRKLEGSFARLDKKPSPARVLPTR